MATNTANSGTLTDTLAEKICRDLRRRGLEEDAVYMTEAAVAKRFSASRNVTREAISQLRASDLAPIHYERSSQAFTAGVAGGHRLSASFANNVVTVDQTQTAPGQKPKKTVRELTPPYYLYGDQGFEHWVLLATRLEKLGTA